jgi:ABC-type transport system involved in cytochrome c biogenesis ATPase subunit
MSRVTLTDVVLVEDHRIYLAGIDLVIVPGELTILQATPRPCGRMLLRLLAGQQLPTQGDVRIGSVSLCHEPERYRSRVGSVAPSPSVPRWVTVGEWLRGQPCRSPAWFEQVIDLFDLPAALADWLDELDALTAARVAFARALLPDPELLLLDRPFAWREDAEQTVRQRLGRSSNRSPLELEQALEALRQSHEVLIDEWREMLIELAALGKAIVVSTEEPQRPVDPRHRLLMIEDGKVLPAALARAASARLACGQTAIRLQPGDPRQLEALAELTATTFGFNNVQLVGDEVIASYAGSLAQASLRISSRAQLAEIPLARVGQRRQRPSRLPYAL